MVKQNVQTILTLTSIVAAVFLVAGGSSLVLNANAQTQSPTDIEGITQDAQHLTGLLYSVTAITTQCTNQINMGNYGIIAACGEIVASLDDHMTAAFKETETGRNSILETLY